VRETVRDGDGFSRTLHAKMAAMGWTGLIIPEACGGLALRCSTWRCSPRRWAARRSPDVFLLLGAGRPHPHAQRRRGAERGRGCRVSRRARRSARWRCSRRATGSTPPASRARCAKTRTGYRLNGTKLFVTDAHVADFIIVACRSRGQNESGVACSWCRRDSAGVSVSPLPNIDQTRRPCAVVFRNVDVPASARLADESRGWKVVSRVLDAACVVLAADSLGGAERALELSVEYAKTRAQFGRPIGSFQAIKHIAAEMVSEIEPARALVWYAAYAFDEQPRLAARAASMAKARLGDVYSRTTNRAVQIHGGIGFTWEHDMHLWFKRAKWNEAAFGDATFHRERLARLAGW